MPEEAEVPGAAEGGETWLMGRSLRFCGSFKDRNLSKRLVVAMRGWPSEPIDGPKGGWTVRLSIYLSICLSICVSICLSSYLSTYLCTCKLEKEAILRDVLSFRSWQHQKRGNSARRPQFLK